MSVRTRDGQDRCGCCASDAVRNCRSYDGRPQRGCASPIKYGPSSGTRERTLIDPAHTFAYFGASHHIVGLVRGRFDKVTGTISAAKEPADCVSIGTASIDTQVARRDEDLRGPDFFDVKNFPAMTYRGRGIRKSADDAWVMDGLLTIRGVTKEVPLTFRFKGLFPGMPAGQPARTSFLASAVLYPPSPPHPAQQSRVHLSSACRPHHRHRRKYQHLQRRRQGPPSSLSPTGTRTASCNSAGSFPLASHTRPQFLST